jgi:hypothetical protein
MKWLLGVAALLIAALFLASFSRAFVYTWSPNSLTRGVDLPVLVCVVPKRLRWTRDGFGSGRMGQTSDPRLVD